MPRPDLPPDVRGVLETMQRDIERAWDQVKAEEATLLRQWPADRRPVRIRRLREMETNARDLMVRLEQTLAGKIPEGVTMAYEIGAWGTALQTGAVATFSAVDINAATVIASDTYDDVLTATRGVRESAKGLVRQMGRDRILNATYAGLTAEQAGVKLAADLAGEGITSIVYQNGARVALPSYTDMLLRTKTAIAYQEGGFQQGIQLGIDWWELMDGPDCGLSYHDDPTLADGLILPTVEAERYPISHPNCVRVTSPRPDIESKADAARATRTSSEEQVADQAAASRARAEAHARNPRRAGLQRQVDREMRLRSGDVEMPRQVSAAEARQARRVNRSVTEPRKGYGDIPIPLDDLLAPTRDGVKGSAAAHLRADGTFTPARQALHDKIVRDATQGIPAATGKPSYTMLGGGPASGKTTVIKSGVTDVRDTKAAVHVNADDLKELIPEVSDMQAVGDTRWAAFSHEESSYLGKRIQAAALENRQHVVLDGTGDSALASVVSKIEKAREAGYEVNGVYVSINTETAVARSAARGARTGRVVPDSVIREVHAGVSEVYPQVAKYFDRTQLVSNETTPTIIARGVMGEPLEIVDEGLWRSFLAKAGNR